jgi:hypothetical protein
VIAANDKHLKTSYYKKPCILEDGEVKNKKCSDEG